MSRVSFRDAAFDIVLAINALHHCSDLDTVAANIARSCGAAGRRIQRTYCGSVEDRVHFGAAQIEAGINEHTYRCRRAAHSRRRAGGQGAPRQRFLAAVYENVGVDPPGTRSSLPASTAESCRSRRRSRRFRRDPRRGNQDPKLRDRFGVSGRCSGERSSPVPRRGGGKTLASFDNLRRRWR